MGVAPTSTNRMSTCSETPSDLHPDPPHKGEGEENECSGKRPQIPFGHSESYKKAAQETKSNQGKLL